MERIKFQFAENYNLGYLWLYTDGVIVGTATVVFG